MGVGTQRNTTSASVTAAAAPTTNCNRPAARPSATSSGRPGSRIDTCPADSRATLTGSTSAHTTRCPNEAKHAPVVKPTYPEPITAMRRTNMCLLPLTFC
jgi:hypothetical protein